MDVKVYPLALVMQALVDLLTTDQQALLEDRVKSLVREQSKPVGEPDNIWHRYPGNTLGGSI